MKDGRRKPTVKSLVTWRWDATNFVAGSLGDREREIDDRLEAEHADGFVQEYDTGRGWIVWFQAPAGKRARELRDWVRARIPADWTAGGDS